MMMTRCQLHRAALQIPRRVVPCVRSFSSASSSNLRPRQVESSRPSFTSTTPPNPKFHGEALEKFILDLRLASQWNHGQEGNPYDEKLWDPTFCRSVVECYEEYLKNLPNHSDTLLSAETVIMMLKTVLKSRLKTAELAQTIRRWEKIWGEQNQTPLSDHVTLRLLTANAKAGNVGRVLKLLQLRLQKQYHYRRRELEFAINSLRVHQKDIPDPTRWLDAILVHMHQRKIPLDSALANRMIRCFVGPKEVEHYFFQIQARDKSIRYHNNAPPYYRGRKHNYSYPLVAAFSFAESLQQGACGHDPVAWNVHTHNTLLKVCVNRNALTQAKQQLDLAVAIEPMASTYNLLLQGHARLGDVVAAQDLYHEMLAMGLEPNGFTVKAVVDGLLNVGDIGGAVTAVGDFFHQHTTLPPYTTHLKILEFALGQDLVFEAKRYLYFLQELWRWQPNSYHTEEQIKMMQAVQRNEQLQRPALEALFSYFNVTLTDDDFL